MAPLITEGFRTIRNIEIPEIELPKIKRKDERYNYDDGNTSSDGFILFNTTTVSSSFPG